MQSLHPHLPTSKHGTLLSLAEHPLSKRRDSELGPFQMMKYLHAQNAVLGKDPSLNLKCVSYTPYTQSLKIPSYRHFSGLYFSCDPSQGTGVEISTHSVQRAQKVSDFRFSELRGLTSTKHPLSTRGARVFLSTEKSKAITRHVCLSRMGPSHWVKERKQNCPAVFNTRQIEITPPPATLKLPKSNQSILDSGNDSYQILP